MSTYFLTLDHIPQWASLNLVGPERFELSTNGLKVRCSSAELRSHINYPRIPRASAKSKKICIEQLLPSQRLYTSQPSSCSRSRPSGVASSQARLQCLKARLQPVHEPTQVAHALNQLIVRAEPIGAPDDITRARTVEILVEIAIVARQRIVATREILRASEQVHIFKFHIHFLNLCATREI